MRKINQRDIVNDRTLLSLISPFFSESHFVSVDFLEQLVLGGDVTHTTSALQVTVS